MKIRQMHEWKVLLAHIKAEEEHYLRRQWMHRIGLALYLKKIAVIRQLLEYYEKRKRRSLEEYHLQLKESLRRRHENEARELRRRYEALMRLERLEFRAPVFACWEGADRDVLTMTHSFKIRDQDWSGGWYGQTTRTEQDAWTADRDPAEYMREAAEYDLGFGYDPEADFTEPGASFGDTQTFTWSDDLSGSFNAAAYGETGFQPGDEDTEEEKAGAHAAGPGYSFGPG
jgi:hypothetical protein